MLEGPPHTWPLDARLEWEERAGIMEFDGGLSTSQAEEAAEQLVRADWLQRASAAPKENTE